MNAKHENSIRKRETGSRLRSYDGLLHKLVPLATRGDLGVRPRQQAAGPRLHFGSFGLRGGFSRYLRQIAGGKNAGRVVQSHHQILAVATLDEVTQRPQASAFESVAAWDADALRLSTHLAKTV